MPSDNENGSGQESPVFESSRASGIRTRTRNTQQRTQERQESLSKDDEDDVSTRCVLQTPAKRGRRRTSFIWNHCPGRGIHTDCNYCKTS